MDDQTLHGYLQHHWVGSTGGVALFRRVGRTHRDPAAAASVRRIAEEVAEDRDSLRRIMHAVGTSPSRVGTVVATAGERFGRLKPNGDLLRRTPLTDIVELESLRLALCGKRAGWEVLASVAPDDDRLDEALIQDLLRRGEEHLREVERLHVAVASRLITERGQG